MSILNGPVISGLGGGGCAAGRGGEVLSGGGSEVGRTSVLEDGLRPCCLDGEMKSCMTFSHYYKQRVVWGKASPWLNP